MDDIKHFIGRIHFATEQANPCTITGLWGELDVEQMFPNIPEPLIAQPIQFYWSLLCKSKGGQGNEFCFFLHKSGDKSLDHVARPSTRTDSYLKFTINPVLAFMHWGLIFNGRRVSLSSIFAQTTGCPMRASF